MSIHAMIAAAYIENLDPSTRLVLMAFADSSDEHTLEAAPGFAKLRAWSGRSESQVKRLVAELADPKGLGLIERIAPGRLGRRAVYRVFPNGVPAIPTPDEVAARYADNEVVPIVDNAPSYPQEDPETGAHGCAPRGASTPSEGRMGAPPSCITSVSLGDDSAKPPARRVDKPTPSASTGSGFPGARKPAEVEDAAGIARRARGAQDRPCPIGDHGRLGEIHGGCGRCAHAAANADPAVVAAARKAAREGIRKARTTTTTEEASAS